MTSTSTLDHSVYFTYDETICNKTTFSPELTNELQEFKCSAAQNTLTHLGEEDRNDKQNRLFDWRHTDSNQRHLKKLNRSLIFQLTMTLDSITESTSIRANLFNTFFYCVISSEETYDLEDVNVNIHVQPTTFCMTRTRYQKVITEPDVTKSKGPYGIPAGVFFKMRNKTCDNLNVLF